ncbi:prolyl oligopeptidase family serine peptidase [Paenibacillus filicis]|uniref:Prolyl oligopeptidase family serine peptidase n=1 Tax=Paenibacillus gyeongsangnamensis TaxID=3388067 RepID=A0ABT4QFQ6_9BACL|nr:alpha/beta fold hydrolase [Paenibacillus filicis]MCZ8515712.1 prolyl oligopeptidase family serine peptidase [Paenibacillus filicis]
MSRPLGHWILAVSLLFSVWVGTPVSALGAAAEQGVSYDDIPSDHYAAKAIGELSRQGVVSGNTEGRFSPDAPITRGEAALWLSKALKLADPVSLSGFSDVPASSPYAKAVNALRERKIAEGDQGRFEPDATLTREQMASLLVRAFGLKDNGINVWLKDEAAIADAHYRDVVKLKQHFLTNQLEFMPKDRVTRAQMALFLYRAAVLGESKSNQIPLDDFLKLPAKTGFQVSPDGKKLALLEPWEGRLNISVQTIGEDKSSRITSSSNQDVTMFTWINDETLIYMTDTNGNEEYHVHAVNKDGTGDKDLTPFEGVRTEFVDSIDYKPGHENEVLVAMNKRNPKEMDLYRLNFKTGELQLAEQNPGKYMGWMTNNYGDVLLALASDGAKTKVLYRKKESDPFETVLTVDAGDTFQPLMFAFDDRQIYTASDIGRDKKALVKFDPEKKKITETVYENPQADVLDIKVSYKKRAILAVIYETDRVQYQFMDSEYEQLYKKIGAKLSGASFGILGNPFNEKRVLIHTGGDKTRGAYYFYEPKTDKLEKLADVSPWLPENQLSDMKPISYMARDGLLIHGYLTLPKSADPKKLPVVVLPHGGPWARDSWGFDSEVQLLANRGYAVLQMNFRGSTGYGKAFLNAGNKQWGRSMQDDITDGVQWLIGQGIADSKRVAIYGASYGGYAALAGVTFTPDVYAAGIDYVGPSNLFTFLASLPPYWEVGRAEMYMRIGDPEQDKKLLEDSSPLMHADQIKVPLMIVQGMNDPRIKKAESDQIVMALRARGIDSPYMVKSDEGHGFRKQENQSDFYKALLKFLEQHLGS